MVNLAHSLIELGRRVEIVLARGRGPLREELYARVTVRNLNGRGRVGAVPALTRYLKQATPRVLLSHTEIANVAALVSHGLADSDAKLVVCWHLAFSGQVSGARRAKG